MHSKYLTRVSINNKTARQAYVPNANGVLILTIRFHGWCCTQSLPIPEKYNMISGLYREQIHQLPLVISDCELMVKLLLQSA